VRRPCEEPREHRGPGHAWSHFVVRNRSRSRFGNATLDWQLATRPSATSRSELVFRLGPCRPLADPLRRPLAYVAMGRPTIGSHWSGRPAPCRGASVRPSTPIENDITGRASLAGLRLKARATSNALAMRNRNGSGRGRMWLGLRLGLDGVDDWWDREGRSLPLGVDLGEHAIDESPTALAWCPCWAGDVSRRGHHHGSIIAPCHAIRAGVMTNSAMLVITIAVIVHPSVPRSPAGRCSQ
jgi:hypothetical protein